MAIVTGDQYLESLVKFVENQAERLIEGTLILKLNPVGLRYVQSRLEALEELESLIAGAPVDYLRAYVSDLGDHRALEQLRRILRLLPSLKVVSVLPLPARDPTPLYLLPFGRLKVLELRGCDLSTSAAKGLLELRFTLEKLICHNSTDALRHVFASRIAEIKDSPQWNRLSFVSCACNGLVLMDESLQLLPVVETLDLSRNKFTKVDNLRKCTKLKHLDLGFNNLRSIASLCEVPCQIVKLDLRNNALFTLHGLESLKSLVGLDLSYNIISNFSEMEILTGLPSLQNLWLEGNPLCCARWFRAQIFSLFFHPEKLKLDEKRISPSEFWKRQIIVASRLQQPASFGFYVPAKDDAGCGGISAKRKSNSRVVSIENEEQSMHVCSDQDSVSCDNEIQSKDENSITDNQTEIEHLMKRIEFMKKEHSVLWLQEFKEWMDQTSGNVVDGSKLRNMLLSNNKEIHNDGEIKDEELVETSRYVSDSIQHSGDESSTMILESETSFADTSTVVSAQRYFDRINDMSSKFCMGHLVGDRSVVVNNLSLNREEPRFLNDEVSVSADAEDSSLNLLEVTRSDMSNKKLISPSIAINNIIGSRSSSACPGSPPHYQEDILHRRQNLEEEFLQLSAESFSVASSDSNTSCSEDDSAEVAPKMTQVYQSFVHNISGRNDCFMSSDRGNDYVKNSALKQNGIPMSSPFTKGNFNSNEGMESEVSTHAYSGSMTDAMHDYEIVDFLKGETDWLEKSKRRRKPRRRLISLPEDDGTLDDTDSSKKSSDYIEICRSYMESEGKECCMSDLSNTVPVRSNGAGTTPNMLKCNRGLCCGLNTLSDVTDDFIETYFNSNLANSGVNEISMQHMQCNCLFPGKSGHYERDVAVIRSSKHKLYILLIVNECDASGTGLEIIGCHRIGDIREVFVGLGLQVVRVHFEGNATYLFITRCVERTRELLGVLDFLDSSRKKECCSLTSLEQVQINLFEENICGGSKINVFQYSMVLFWRNNLEENLWLSRSLFILEGHLILCTEDLLQFGPTENAFFPNYFSLDSYCAIANVSEMVIDTIDNLCVTLALECTCNVHPSEEAYRIGAAICQNKKPFSHPSTWKLKWFSKESLFNFVALLKAIHGQTTSSPLIASYKS